LFIWDIYIQNNIMGRIVKLTESQLKSMIEEIMSEANPAPAQQSSYQSGYQTGQQHKQAVKQAATAVIKGAQQVVITIGKTVFTAITYGGAVVYLIGSGLFKLSMMAHNAIMKFLASTGRAVIGGATLLGQKTMSGLKAAGVAIERGAEALSQSFNKLKENTANVMKWIFNSFKQFGAAVWGKVLLAGSAIKELAGIVGDFFKNTYNTVANAVGKTWDQAKGMAQQAYSKVKDTASNIGKGISSAYDKTRGYLSGFLSEIFERFLSMNNMTGHELISECVKYNNKVIL
jgi:hypothetical protein